MSDDKNPPWNFNYSNGHNCRYKYTFSIIDDTKYTYPCQLCGKATRNLPALHCTKCFFKCEHCLCYHDLHYFYPVDYTAENGYTYKLCHFCYEREGYDIPDVKEPEMK